MNLLPAGTPGLEVRPGEGATVGFRAEDVTCAPASGNGSALAFDLAERAGADRLWYLRAGERPVVVRAPDGAEPPAAGAPVTVRVTPGRERWFDGEGRALA